MYRKQHIIPLLAVLMFALPAKSQFSVPRLSQFLNNGLSVNPAYAGSREAFSFTGVSRNVYTGFDGNPQGFLAGAHTPLKKGNVAVGFSIENSRDPGVSNTGIYTHYAYRLWLGKMRLSMGLRGGLYNYSINRNNLDLQHPTDPAFISRSGFAPNFGAGLYLYNPDFFVGFSVPYFLDLPENNGFGGKLYAGGFRYILTTGFLFRFSDQLKLKPVLMSEYSSGRFDLQGGANVIILNDKLWLGALYRTTSRTLTAIAEVQLSAPLRMGIAYDYSFLNISRVSSGSFEFMFRYELNYKSVVTNPIYF